MLDYAYRKRIACRCHAKKSSIGCDWEPAFIAALNDTQGNRHYLDIDAQLEYWIRDMSAATSPLHGVSHLRMGPTTLEPESLFYEHGQFFLPGLLYLGQSPALGLYMETEGPREYRKAALSFTADPPASLHPTG